MTEDFVVDGPVETLVHADIVHLYCCDESRALCGLDLTGEPPGAPEDPVCRPCADRASLPCGAPDCPDLAHASISDQLCQAQEALAASQADLTRVERERDEAAATLAGTQARLKAVGDQHRAQLKENAGLAAELERERQESGRLRRELELVRDDLDKANHRHRIEWRIERDACVKLRRERDEARADLAAARNDLDAMRLRLADTTQDSPADRPGQPEGEQPQ